MISTLPIHPENLLRKRQVEGECTESKAGCHLNAPLRTLCSFANDFRVFEESAGARVHFPSTPILFS